MAVKLNERAFSNAKKLILDGKVVLDEMDEWSEHQPSVEDENKFIEANGFDEYGKWYLGIDDEASEDTKGYYKFPFGDFKKVHRCGVIAVEVRAGQYKYSEIEVAAAHLHGMMDRLMAEKRRAG